MKSILDAIKRELDNFEPVLDEEKVGSQQSDIISIDLHLQQDIGGLRASIRWFSWTRLFMYLPWTIVGFLLAWFFGEVWFQNYYMWLFFILPCLALGLGGTYLCLTILFNSSTIQVAGGELGVHHGPLPFPGNRSVQCSDLKLLYAERVVLQRKVA